MNPGIKKDQFLLIQHSLQEIFTPVQFLMTVLSHVGDTEVVADWATVEHLMQIHLRPRAVLE